MTTDNGTVEQSAGVSDGDSVAADLAASMAELEADTTGSDSNPQQQSTEIDPGNDADLSGTEDADTAETDGETDQEAQADSGELIAPDHWAEDHRNVFNALAELGDQGKAAQQFLIDRHKAMEGDYTRKTQALADFSKTYEPIAEMLSPYQNLMAQEGITATKYLSNVIKGDLYIKNDPVAGIKWLMQSYGITPDQIGGQAAAGDDGGDDYVDPQIAALQQEIKELKDASQQRQTAEAEAKQSNWTAKITAFADEKDDQGNLKHPHFDSVISDMTQLALVQGRTGQPVDLPALYEQAIWANPETRAKLIAEQSAREKEKTLQDMRKKSDNAKRASASVSGETDAGALSDDLSLRETIERQF